MVKESRELKAKVDQILKKYQRDKGMLVSILQDVQAVYNYLPKESLTHVSKGLDIPQSQVFSVTTFFKAFNLLPRGRHIISVCLGTACHVRGGIRVLDRMEEELGVTRGKTTPDLRFTLESVNCLGTCALGPMVVIDGEYSGQMTADKVKPLLAKYS